MTERSRLFVHVEQFYTLPTDRGCSILMGFRYMSWSFISLFLYAKVALLLSASIPPRVDGRNCYPC